MRLRVSPSAREYKEKVRAKKNLLLSVAYDNHHIDVHVAAAGS
jgi:hypothetical protein